MSNQASSSCPILCASFNQDASYLAIGTRLGFMLFEADTGRLCYQRDIGAFGVVEMRFCSSLLAIVGAGEQPALSPRRLCLFNTTTGTALQELNFLTSVLAVRLNKSRLLVILQDKTFIYDIDSLAIFNIIDTVPNLKADEYYTVTRRELYTYNVSEGLWILLRSYFYMCLVLHYSSSYVEDLVEKGKMHLDGCFLALPASTTRGSVLVYNVMELHSHCEIEAHHSPLAAMVLSMDGAYLATASEQGTIIRVHSISDGTKSYSFRRGTIPSTIFSLSFGPSVQLPDILAATSSSGSLHIFMLETAVDQRSRRSSSFLGSVMPGSISDVLDPAHHHVFHNVARGVKSYVVIRKVEKVADSLTSEVVSFRAVISVIAYNGYFREYSFSINPQNETSWSLEREFNLLTAIPDGASGS